MDNMVGQTIGNRYRFEAFLGRGGMASVYKVWDQQRSVSLAVKMLHSDLAEDKVFVRRFRREAETLAQLQHPNIIRFYGLEEFDGLAFIVMDFVEGSSLRSEIARAKQPLSAKRILEVLRPVCSALNYAHKMGVVHCDMKPANVLIDTAGKAYISDFGIARVVEHSTTTTMTGAGTPAYMPPEQIRGEPLTPQSDLYALGIILYEMLTGGERPFTGDTAPESISTAERVRWEHLHQQAEFPPEFKERIAPQITAVVLRCLDKAPEKRYGSAMDLLLGLERAMASAAAQQLGVPYVEPEPVEDPHSTDVLQPKPTLLFPPEPTVRNAQQPIPEPAPGAAVPPSNRPPAMTPLARLPSMSVESGKGKKPPLGWIAALFLLLMLATCGIGMFAVSQTPFGQGLLNIGGVVEDTVVSPMEPVAQITPTARKKAATPTDEKQAPKHQPSATTAPSVTPEPSATATLFPTPTSIPTPRAYDFETCLAQCNGGNAQSRFPGGTTELYFRYKYENIPTGAHYIRTWEVPGKGEWVRYDCTWPGPENGELNLRLFDNDGLQSGTWILTIAVDEKVLLREQVVLTGNFNFWTPAGTFNSCTGKR